MKEKVCKGSGHAHRTCTSTQTADQLRAKKIKIKPRLCCVKHQMLRLMRTSGF